MYSANARVFLESANRVHIFNRLVQNQVLNCVCLRFATCTIHRQKKHPPLSKLSNRRNVQHSQKPEEEELAGSIAKRKKHPSLSSLITPVCIQPSTKSEKVGEELTGSLEKTELLKVINEFNRSEQVKLLAAENGIDESIFLKGQSSFRKYCLQSDSLPADLHVSFSDIIIKAGNVLDIWPYFLRHMKEMYPHLDCMDDLKKIGDIREPANWFPEARKLQRKFYFHCGPTNSGKTYQAIQNFLKAKSGIYCAPLKLLAVEVHQMSNRIGTPCDLITGEEIVFVDPSGDCSSHNACTVEMCSLEKSFDVAVIDEIQMLKDPQRGWAWTRALLGLKANEIHLCGEEAAIDVVDSILCTTGEKIEITGYKRLTKLQIDSPLESLQNARPGDCIVCFNKTDIFSVAKVLETLNHKVGIIYGSLPPQTKIFQCENFNDPNHPCKILVATDAIGMGLNLNIRRIIFYSLLKISVNEFGEAERKIISVSQALQIAGRAGRFGSNYEEGFVTTFKKKDLETLKVLLSEKPEKISQAGLQPTPDQIELFSYYLPNASLSELIDIFCNLCTVDDSLYFICHLMEIKALAELLDHIPLQLRVKYVFCSAPVNRKMHFVTIIFVGFAKMFSLDQVVDAKWVCRKLNWPLEKPKNWRDLAVLESYYEVLDLYLWLSNRFEEHFPDAPTIREMQRHIDSLIQYGVLSPKKLSQVEDSDSECNEIFRIKLGEGEISPESKLNSANGGS